MPAASQTQFFACDGCGKRYRWKHELAGRKVLCRCGMVMVCPIEPVDLADVADDEYSLAPAAKAQATAMPARAVEASAVPTSAKPVELAYRSAGSAGDSELFPDKAIDLHLPLVLLAAGTIVQVTTAVMKGLSCCGGWGVFLAALKSIGIGLIVGPSIMLVGLFIAARFRGIQFGNVYVAALKLAAIAIGPGAVSTLLAPIAGVIPFFGGILLLIVQFAIYFALIGTMFKLDEDDTWYCVCVFFVLSVGLYFASKALPWGL